MIYATFYNHIRSGNLITSVLLESEIVINQNLVDFDDAEFDLPYQDGVSQYNKVVLVDELNNQLFSGRIYELEPYFDKDGKFQLGIMKVTLRGQKAILKDRLMLSDLSYTSVAVSTILQAVLGQYTSYGDARTIDCESIQAVTIDLKSKDNLYDIISELAQQCECVRDIQDGVILFKSMLGSDKTGSQEISFNGAMTLASNIAGIKPTQTAKRANIVIGEDKSGNKLIKSNVYGFVYGVATESFRDGDLADKTQKLLDKLDQDQTSYEVVVENNTIEASKGDLIRLRVENTTFDIDSGVYVTQVKTTYTQAGFQQEFTVSQVLKTAKTLQTIINGITKNLTLLSL